jgi:circadian clock protein KaiB
MPSHPKTFRLRLYVGGVTPASTRAVVNARRLCDQQLGTDYELEVLDVRSNVHLAREDQVVAIPPLVKLEPAPARSFIGDLSNASALVLGPPRAQAETGPAEED